MIRMIPSTVKIKGYFSTACRDENAHSMFKSEEISNGNATDCTDNSTNFLAVF